MRYWKALLMRAAVVPLLLAAAGCGGEVNLNTPQRALIVVSPHPDDESIFGGGTIYRLAADPSWYVHAIYISGGDRATVPGDCNGIPEAQKTQMIVALRERETRAAWAVLAPTRDVPIDFLRGPDMGLVASSSFVGGVRHDVLSEAGAGAVARAVPLATQLPPSVHSVLFLTTSMYDGHPDHRTAYHAARAAAELLRQRQLDVRIWSWIVHDEVSRDVSRCCVGDFHWPARGPHHDYLALTDAPARPRPPYWDRVEDVADVTNIRHDALAQHVSQVVGYPPLCMPVYIPDFYTRWNEKIEEPFYDETL